MNNEEPTVKEIQEYMERTGLSFYNAREELREMAYSNDYEKASSVDWGTFWKTF